MYLWNTNKLVADHKAGPLSQNEQFKYFLVYILVTTIALEIPVEMDGPLTLIDIFKAIGSIAITALGTLLVFRANSTGDNCEFLSRYFSLSLPILIKLTVLMVAFTIFYFAVVEIGLGIDVTTTANWLDILILYGFGMLFYWRLYVHIYDVSHYKNVG